MQDRIAERRYDPGLTDVIWVLRTALPRQHTLVLPGAWAGDYSNELLV